MNNYFRRFKEEGYEEASDFHREYQQGLKKKSKRIMYSASIIGLVSYVYIFTTYDEDAAHFFLSGIFIWYMFGYFYCNSLWDIEKDDHQYYLLLEEYKNENPDKFDEHRCYKYDDD